MSRERLFLLLTLFKHKDGVWVTKLVHELQKIDAAVEIVTAEELLHETRVDSEPSMMLWNDKHQRVYDGIINRISDAADPILVKRCLAILTIATQLHNVPVFNGPIAYTLCSNKWCHHVIFARAGLSTPSTAVLLPSQYSGRSTSDDALSPFNFLAVAKRVLGNETTPYLLKPNSGGFGAGITRIDHKSNVHEDDLGVLCPVSDDTILLQQYIPPANGHVYRVWFLLGKVQCAIQRRTDLSSHDEFGNGCSAGNKTCNRPDDGNPGVLVSSVAWPLTPLVRDEVEGLLKILPDDAHAGSVEFLVDATSGQRLYFDLNLLSTLPDTTEVLDAAATWGESYNPWMELAEAVVRNLQKQY